MRRKAELRVNSKADEIGETLKSYTKSLEIDELCVDSKADEIGETLK
ncbi:MAG: hypothetical protein ABIG20_03575 [archaeon]